MPDDLETLRKDHEQFKATIKMCLFGRPGNGSQKGLVRQMDRVEACIEQMCERDLKRDARERWLMRVIVGSFVSLAIAAIFATLWTGFVSQVASAAPQSQASEVASNVGASP